MVLSIGTDCSGIEAPVMALRRLKVPHKHLWSCEIDPYARESIKTNYNPEVIYDDIKKKRDLPQVDIYVAGFPCQAFSMAGRREGVQDPRGTIFWDCVKTIKTSQPKIFILENVKGLLSIDDGKTFQTILKTLKRLKVYNIYWKVLNTKDYGIPQNRERIFIIGIKNNIQTKEFEWPKTKKMKDIYKILEKGLQRNNITDRIKKNLNVIPDIDFFDTNFKCYSNRKKNYTPTIVTKPFIYSVKYQRYLVTKELLQLQGFPKSFKLVVSDTQIKRQIGNSMTVDVIMELYKSIRDCTKNLF